MLSWRRACKHAVLPVLVVAIGGFAVAGITHGDAYALGRLTGELVAPVFGVALLISALIQTGRTTAAWAIGIGAPALLSAGVIVWLAIGRPVPPLTDAERAPLVRAVIAGEPRLRNPALELSIRDPGPTFVPQDVPNDPSAPADLRAHNVSYAYADASAQAAVLVSISNGAGATEQDFRTFLDGMVAGVARSTVAAGRPEPKTTRSDVTWTADRHDARLDLELTDRRFRIAAYAVHPRTAPPYVVAIVAIGPATGATATALDTVVGSFKQE